MKARFAWRSILFDLNVSDASRVWLFAVDGA
jgi:hypothetical protein